LQTLTIVEGNLYDGVVQKLLIASIALILAACTSSSNPIPTTDQEVKSAASKVQELAKTWLISNIREKGLFVYRYDPETGSTPSAQNELRQLMASRVLAILAAQDPSLLPLHQKNMQFILEHWYKEDGSIGYVYFDHKSKLGANAMLLRALIASPDVAEYRAKAKRVAQGIVSLQETDGSFRAWFHEPDYAYDEDYLLTFYSGEAILALLEYAETAKDQDVFNAAKKAQDFYMEKYVTNIEKNYYPAYVPWHTMSLAHLYEKTRDRRYADAIFVLNDELLHVLDTTEHLGRFYNPLTPEYGTPHSSSDAVYTEGLAFAYGVAKQLGDEARELQYRFALGLALYNLSSLQYSSKNNGGGMPEKMLGGVRVSIEDSEIRVDTVQHTWDAMSAILDRVP
jgi:hypothetical protein